ncbi:ABC transporter ATP-binding protein [Pantanalinema rosaneae CENA516]|uniref:ABC transporter ATP-binding protein n=1 Tax=Pantanalinema rosaneae TaxID=1620701 RepID=UPI003D6F138B
MDVIANLDQVSYLYPGSAEPVLRDISLTIRRGEFLGIIGPTGAGKTTLCLALNGIVPQFYGGRFFGRITVAGMDTLEHPVSQLARHVGTVFEDPEIQLTSTSVENEIAFPLENLCVPRATILDRIPRVLAAVRLQGFEQKSPEELSGGQKQRLAIATALAIQPDLLILDEPTSQLDPIGTQEVFATVQKLQALGVTIVMVSHAAEELAEYADRIALMAQGRLIAVGTPQEIYAQVELLETYQLRSPEVSQTFEQIRQRGITPATIPVTLATGIAALPDLQPISQIAPPPQFPPSVPPDQPPILSVQNLTHIYQGGTQALHQVSLDIHPGEYVLIIGQNGAGKSTLVKHFLNLLQPTQGVVRVRDRDTRELSVSDLARSIGYLAQNPDNQIFSTTVEQEVAFALPYLGYAPNEIKEETMKSLKAMQLWHHREAHPLSLPKGERARIVIAALLAMNPDIVIFDEPTIGQDFQGACSILDVTRQLHQMGKTVIVITHHLYLMPNYAQRVIVMGQGTILLDVPLRQAYHQTQLLQSTYLVPPQSVLLAQHLGHLVHQAYPLVTPQEVASLYTPNP